jgi:hypothetical protein
MSINRDQNVASDTSSVVEMPLKKRKDSRFHSYLSLSDGGNAEQKKKKWRNEALLTHPDESISQADSSRKRMWESFPSFYNGGGGGGGDDDDCDCDNTVYRNPYLNHMRSDITSQECEAGHNHVSSLVSNMHVAGNDKRAQARSPSCKYFQTPGELHAIASDTDEVIDLKRPGSKCERLGTYGDIFSAMRLRFGETSHSNVSPLIPIGGSNLLVSDLKKEKTDHAELSSTPLRCFEMPVELSDGLVRNKAGHGCSEISVNRTSSTEVRSDSVLRPPVSCKDLFPLYNDIYSQNIHSSSLSSVGTNECGHLQTSVFGISPFVPQFKTGLSPSLKMCEKDLYPSLEFGTETKPSEHQTGASPLSLMSSRDKAYLRPELGIQTSSFSLMKSHEGESYSGYGFNVHSKTTKPESGSASSVGCNEQEIRPISQCNIHPKTETLPPSVSWQSKNFSESLKDNGRLDGADNSFKNMNCTETNSSKEERIFVLPKSKVTQLNGLHLTRKTPHFEINAYSNIGTTSSEESPCNYKKSEDNSESHISGSKYIAGQQYQREGTDIMGEEGAVDRKDLPCKRNYIPKDSDDTSRIVRVKSKEVQNVMKNHDDVNQGMIKYSRECSEEEVPVCINDIHPLMFEGSNGRNSSHEEAILMPGDSLTDGISDYDINDCFEDIDDTDDIEILQYVFKSDVSTNNSSVQQKALDCTKGSTSSNDFKDTNQKNFAHQCELSKKLNFSKSPMVYKGSVFHNNTGNLMDEQRAGSQLSKTNSKTGMTYNNVMNPSSCASSRSITCVNHEVQPPAPALTPQVLRGGVYDSSHTVSQSEVSPYCVSKTHSIPETSRRKMLSPFGSFGLQSRRLQDGSLPEFTRLSRVPTRVISYTGSSYSPPVKKHCYDSNLVPDPDGYDTGGWNPAIPSSSTDNFVASNTDSIKKVFANSPGKYVEPDSRVNISVSLKEIPGLTSVCDTSLQTSAASYNVQGGLEMYKKKEARCVSNSDGGEKQQNIIEDKMETTQKDSRLEWECAICLETVSSKRGISSTMCGHVYCTPCITEVVCKKMECPTCRRTLDTTQVHPLYLFG